MGDQGGSAPLLTQPAGDLTCLVRTGELVDLVRTETGRGRDLADGQPRLVGLDDGPDPLALGFCQALRGKADPSGQLLFAANLHFELVMGFHPSGLTISPLAVRQPGRLSVVLCSC